MKINITKKDVIWSYIGTFISLGSNLIILPFIMYFLDGDMLGLWYIFVSIGSIATLFDFGFGVTFARNITYCWSGVSNLKKENVDFVHDSNTDYVLIKNVLQTCKKIYFIIAGTALVLMGTVGTVYILYVARKIPGHSYLVAWGCYVVATFLNLYYGYYASFLRGVGAVDEANKNTVISRLIQIAATVVLLFLGTGLVGACIAYLLYGTVFRTLGKYKFYRYKNIGDNLRKVTAKVSKDEMRTLFSTVWHNAWREGLISVCNYCSNQVSTLICSAYLPLSETGAYSLGVQVASAIATVAAALYNAYQPTLQSAYVNQDKQKMSSTMSLIVVVYMAIFSLGLIGTIFVGLPVLRLIKPETVVLTSVLLGLATYQFMLNFRNCYTSYFSCTNRLPYVKSFVVSAMLCVVLSFMFIGPLQLGIWGLIIAQILSQAVYNLWAWPMKAHREMEISFFSMFSLAKNRFNFKRIKVGK